MKMQAIGGPEVFSDDERLWLGQTLLNRRDPKAALKMLEAVKSENLKDRAMLLKGRAQRLAGSNDAAVETLNELRAISERYGNDAWLELALTYRDMGKADEALGELAPLQNPDRGHAIASRALYEFGVIHQRLHLKTKSTSPDKAEGHANAAREAFKKLWLLYPDREGEDRAKRAYLALAELQQASGDAVGEIKTLNELAEAHPDSPFATYATALIAMRAGKAERADTYLRQTIEQLANSDDELKSMAEKLLRRER
jgi:tetratricopeptide (TPR) repeat protein